MTLKPKGTLLRLKNGKGKYMHFGGSLTFWQACGEADCDLGKGHGRMDPDTKQVLL